MNDAEIRDRILAILYGVWKNKGFEAYVPLTGLVKTLNIQSVAVEHNVELLVKIGLVEKWGVIGGSFYRLSAQGVLECEQKGLEPDFTLSKGVSSGALG
ncbi:MAG: hypothetical protein NZ937_06465 [Armatimonadetes bacterium]|nr:hypothetical protein [Armatimonadota bacterium]